MSEEKKTSVLILIPNFLPGYKMGGPLTSVLNLIDTLSTDFNFKVLTSDRDMGDEHPYPDLEFNQWIQKDNYEVCYVSAGFKKPFNLVKLINAAKVDVVYLQSLFNPVFSIFILLAAKFGFLSAKKVLLAPRGETFDDALNFKPLKKNIFRWVAQRLNLFKKIAWHASTTIEKDLIVKNMLVQAENVQIAINLPQKSQAVNLENAKLPKEGDPFKLVFISRVSKDKNITYTFDILKEIKADVQFDIYGPIEDEYIWDECQTKIKALPANIKVNYKGAVAKTEVKATFLQYDLMFLPTWAENYGHAIVESLSVGTPVLISDNTPWKDLSSKGFGWEISLEDPSSFVKAMETMLSYSHGEKAAKRKKIIEDFQVVLHDPKVIEANKELFSIN